MLGCHRDRYHVQYDEPSLGNEWVGDVDVALADLEDEHGLKSVAEALSVAATPAPASNALQAERSLVVSPFFYTMTHFASLLCSIN